MWKVRFSLILFINYGLTLNPGCDFIQTVEVNHTYHVYSPGYPKYSTSEECRWIATCPEGYHCKLHCPEIDLTQSPDCDTDHLLVSKSGDPQFTSAEKYCGVGALSAVSYGHHISVGLMSSYKARFRCELTAVPASNSSCKCGYRKLTKDRIVGGIETDEYEYPSMAGIVDLRIEQIKCGGVIINKKYVMTAAHCLVGQVAENIAVVAGERDITSAMLYSVQAYKAEKFIIHPKYSKSTYDNDIAIIVLAKELSFGEHVGPVCLPFKFAGEDVSGKNVTVLGWGTVFIGGPKSRILLETSVQVISNQQCQADAPYVTARQICTYTPGKDACQDDSGGPLLYPDPSTGLLFTLGITSHGQSCASGHPAVNTRVTALLDWIVASTHGGYCRK